MNKNLLYYLHFIVPIFIISIPFYPVKYLKYLILFPLVLYITWISFNGCPWTKLHATNDDEHFILDILRNLFPKMSRRQCNCIIGIVMYLIVVICYYKLMNNCEKK